MQKPMNFLTRGICFVLKRRSLSTASVKAASEPEVLFDTAGKIGFITLNRPRQLNALTLNMIRMMYGQLRRYEADPNIGAIVVRGPTGGRAFCAGGDVVAITKSAKSDDPSLSRNFFREEYLLDYATAKCPKPYVSLLDGVCMGGGFGISVHGKYRVATERTLFAMPETAIGLFPDVGGGYFLPRLPNNLGIFLGLTGMRLKGWDVYKAGIATHFCRAEILPELERVLARLYEANFETVQGVLDNFHARSMTGKEFVLKPYLDRISKLFDPNFKPETLLENLEAEGSDWANCLIEIIRNGSPTSVKITQKLFEYSENLELADSLQLEYRLALRCCEHHDFAEGVRALLVERDQKPKWNPNMIELVPDELVEYFFSPLAKPVKECEVVKEYSKPVAAE